VDNLATLDKGIIIVYFVLVACIGIALRKMASGSLEDYFLGGKKLPWWLLGTSGMSAFLDMTGTMIIVSFLFLLGPRGIFIEFRGGAVLILAFCMCWMGKWNRRSNCMTMAEWMHYRFGSGGGSHAARILTACAVIIWSIGMLGYFVRGVGLFLSMFVPYGPLECALVLVAIGTFYTILSGFYGVVFTDFIQSIIILISVVFISVMAFNMVDDAQSLGAVAERVTGNQSWLQSLPSWKTEMPKGYEAYELLIMFALFYFLRQVLGGLNSGGDPKFFGARNERECGKLSCLWICLMMIRWPMMMGFAVMGIYLVQREFPDPNVIAQVTDLIKTHHPEVAKNVWHDLLSGIAESPESYAAPLVQGLRDLLGESWVDKLALVSFEGTVDPERIMPAVILDALPLGLRGLILVAMIAAAMSTFDTEVNLSAAYFVRDIYQGYLRPGAPTRELIYASYAGSILIVVLGFLLGYTAKNINDIWGWVVMGLGISIQVIGLLRWYWWRFNGWGFAAGTFIGLCGAILQRIYYPDLTEWKQFVFILSASLVGAIVFSLLLPPAEDRVLEHFYRTTRPFGLWGRFRRRLNGRQRAMVSREHRNDLLALPFALLWQVTLFILPMQLIMHAYTSFMWTLPSFLIGLAGVYWLWYRNLPPERTVEEISAEFLEAAPADNPDRRE